MKCIVTCISSRRPDNVGPFLNKVGNSDVVFFVRDTKDEKEYRGNGAEKVVVSGGLMDSRNEALKYAFNRGSLCVQLSDDLKKINRNDFTGKRTDVEVSVKEVLNEIIPEFAKREELFGGFPPTNNPFFSLKPIEENKFIVGDFILVKPCNLFFDTNLKLKEDYDYTLQHMRDGKGVVRFGSFLNTFAHYSNSGGAVDYRDDSTEQETIKYLHSKWGECIQLNPARPNEILLNKKSNEILNSKQQTLF